MQEAAPFDTRADEPQGFGVARPQRERRREVPAEVRASREPRAPVRRVIGGSSDELVERPPVHRTIDVHLERAKTSDALQLIADAGGFNLVMEGQLSAPVTVSLRRVDAFDALMVVAQAEGLGVSLERGIVMVGARSAAR